MKLVCEKCQREVELTEVPSITTFFIIYLGLCKKCFAERMDERKRRSREK